MYIYVRTYKSHLLGTYVTTLCNWLILDKTHFTCNLVDLEYV